MLPSEINDKVKEIFLECFPELKSVTGTEEINDIGGWDSLGHVRLITLIETEFAIKIPFDRYGKLQSFSSIVNFLIINF